MARSILPAERRRQLPVQSPDDVRSAQLDRARLLSGVFLGLVVVGFVIVFARVMQLQQWPNDALAEHVDRGFTQRVEYARRGDLLDRRGRVIASSVLGYRLFVDPQACEEPETIALDLAELLDLDPAAIDRTIAERLRVVPESRYVVVNDLLEPWQVEIVRSSALRGIGLTPKLVRENTSGTLASTLIGAVGYEHTGLSGLERRFDERLQPQAGLIRYQRDKRARPLWVELGDFEPSEDGAPVRLSLDLVIQEYVEQRLAEAVEHHAARGARMVVVDPQTGEIVALFDMLNPNFTRDPVDDRSTEDLPVALRPNRCVSDPYEPGSTFKPFIWACATEMGRARPEQKLPISPAGYWRTPYGRKVNDAWPYGESTWRFVLVKSMNTGMAMVAEKLTQPEMQSILRRWGFGTPTRAGIPGETAGVVTPPAKWTEYTQTSVAIGHEIAVNTLQMVRAFSAFARDGSLPMLRLTADDGVPNGMQIEQRAITESTALLVREILAEVMTNGTGRDAQSETYRLFGKSGTAELWDSELGQYHRDRYTASFIAGAPFDHPRLVALCVLDDPDKTVADHGGGHSAGPVVRDVLDFALSYLGVPGDLPTNE